MLFIEQLIPSTQYLILIKMFIQGDKQINWDKPDKQA